MIDRLPNPHPVARALALVLCVLAVGPSPVRSQALENWPQATIGIAAGTDIPEATLDDWLRLGATAVLIKPSGAESSDVWKNAAQRAGERGFSLIVVSGTDSTGAETALVVADGKAYEPFEIATDEIGSLSSDAASLEAIFASRARSSSRPESAPLAVPTGEVDAHWYLVPGPIAVPDGSMSELTDAVAGFRAAHPAVGAGAHTLLQMEPYVFHRGLRLADGSPDEVIVVSGASGRTRLNVASLFADDTVLRDVLTGKIAIVSYGHVAFPAHGSGLILIEPLE